MGWLCMWETFRQMQRATARDKRTQADMSSVFGVRKHEADVQSRSKSNKHTTGRGGDGGTGDCRVRCHHSARPGTLPTPKDCPACISKALYDIYLTNKNKHLYCWVDVAGGLNLEM